MPVEQATTVSARRARGLADIAPKYIAKSGLCAASDAEPCRAGGGSVRIRRLTGSPGAGGSGGAGGGENEEARFPRLDQCAHFHYDQVDLPPLQVCVYQEEVKSLSHQDSHTWYPVQVTAHGASWLLRRTYDNLRLLDQQLHRCIYDRKISRLEELPDAEDEDESRVRDLFSRYLARFSQLAGNLVNCGPVLNWLELDNRGRRLLVPGADDCPINTPAVAAAYGVRRYSAQAVDEISFEVGDMISVIDMPPTDESVWWRGKRGFQVGFFPGSCVAVIGDKVPRSLVLPCTAGSVAGSIGSSGSEPSKPVLRKHGKLIAFFRSFILARPSRRRLKQSGILRERVFGCDLGEHLLNSGHQVPMVLKCCAEFIESHGIVDGIYRLSGVTSNIQKLRNAFDEDRVPALYEDEAILQDIHSVASLLKMYFRELPNPLCTYQLYHHFVGAVGAAQEHRLARMREAVSKLPPPHYRTLQYLTRHLARVAERGPATGMTARNVAIVWAPNLLRCKELEVGGVAALQGVGIQAVVTEFLICYAELIFCEDLPPLATLPPIAASPKRCRPKSLALSTPTKLLSLEEARTRALTCSIKTDTDYIEVGGGPSQLPAQYHTIIDLPRKRGASKRSPLGWKSLFGKSGRKTSVRKMVTTEHLGSLKPTVLTDADLPASVRRRLRPVKSAESLHSGAGSSRNSALLDPSCDRSTPPDACDRLSSPHRSESSLGSKHNGHNRSVSHDSYFDGLETPVHARPTARPSRLQEVDNEDASSSLDLSEIQLTFDLDEMRLDFDLDESEMRIFSEDETLVGSTLDGSGSLVSSLVSTSSPRVRTRSQALSCKRQPPPPDVPPPRARPETSACPSLDPSPKKQKTCDGASPTDSTRSKRSRLEEQLASSTGELRFIDSQSPDNTVVTLAEVHPLSTYSFSDTSSYDPLSATPDTPTQPYAALADRDSTSSSTPATSYRPLAAPRDSSASPSSDARDPSPAVTPSPSQHPYDLFSPSPTAPQRSEESRLSGNFVSRSSSLDFPYNRMSAAGSSVSGNVTPTLSTIDSDSPENVFRYENVLPVRSSEYENVVTCYEVKRSSPLGSPVKESLITIRYENVRSPKREEGGVYQNVPGAGEGGGQDNVYEDVEVTSGLPTCEPKSPAREAPAEEVYQQVKYLRRSVHEINQLLDTDEAQETHFEPQIEPPDESQNVEPEFERKRAEFERHEPTFEMHDRGFEGRDHHFEPREYDVEPRESSFESSEFRFETLDRQFEQRDHHFEAPASDVEPSRSTFEVHEPQIKPRDLHVTPLPLIELPFESQSLHIVNAEPQTQSESVGESGNERNNTFSNLIDLTPTENGTKTLTPEYSNCVVGNLIQLESPTELLTGEGFGSNAADRESAMSGYSDETGENPFRCASGDLSGSAGSPDPEELCPEAASVDPATKVPDEFKRPEERPEERPEDRIEWTGGQEPARRRIESDIGRDIVRDRRMRQELEEIRFSSPTVHKPKVNVRELLSKFETSPTKDMDVVKEFEQASNVRDSFEDFGTVTEGRNSIKVVDSESKNIVEDIKFKEDLGKEDVNITESKGSPEKGFSEVTPKLNRRYGDAGSLPPCLRARAAKTARKLATAMSVSLDEDQFPVSDDGGQLARVLTSPDVADGGKEMQTGVLKPLNATDADDAQRRARIEKYKEERRSFLREKFRSESFRGEKDEVVTRLKQKAVRSVSSVDEPTEPAKPKGEAVLDERLRAREVGQRSPERLKKYDSRLKSPDDCKVEDGVSGREKKAVEESASANRSKESPEKSRKPIEGVLSRNRLSNSPEKSRKPVVEDTALRNRLPSSPEKSRKPVVEDTALRNRLPSSPEKTRKVVSPVTCVVVKERQAGDRMNVMMSVRSVGKDDSVRNSLRGSKDRSKEGSGDPTRNACRSAKDNVIVSPTRSRISSYPDTKRSVDVGRRPSDPTRDATVSPTSPSRTASWGRDKSGARRRGSDETTTANQPRRGSATSPSYCIRDMAAMFEGRGAGEGGSGRAQQPGKQYMSSV